MSWRALALSAALALCSVPALADVHGVPLPSRSKRIGDDHYRSSRGFRKTVRYYQRWLRRRGSTVQEIPVYRYRGVTIARFISRAAAGRWRAIHVFLADGRTQIYVVPGKAAPAPPQATEN